MGGNCATARLMAGPGSAWPLLSFSLFPPVQHPELEPSHPRVEKLSRSYIYLCTLRRFESNYADLPSGRGRPGPRTITSGGRKMAAK